MKGQKAIFEYEIEGKYLNLYDRVSNNEGMTDGINILRFLSQVERNSDTIQDSIGKAVTRVYSGALNFISQLDFEAFRLHCFYEEEPIKGTYIRKEESGLENTVQQGGSQ